MRAKPIQQLNWFTHPLNTATCSNNIRKKPPVALPPSSDTQPANRAALREAAEQAVLMREVDEAVRQDQLSEFVKKYGLALGAAFVLGLGGFGAYLAWNNHQNSGLEEKTDQLVQAFDQLETNNTDAAEKALAALEGDSSEAGTAIAKLTRAGILLGKGNTAEAAKLFEEVAADSSTPGPYRDLATVRAVAAQYDTLKPQEVVDRLSPLAKPGNPWFGSAGELVAMAYLQLNKPDLAGPLLASIAKDNAVPETLRSRVRQMAGVLGVDAIDDVDATMAEISAGAEASAPAPAAAAPAAQ